MSVSIVIPTYNGATSIQATIDAVLGQSYGDFELVVSDDGSTDATLELVGAVNDPRIRILDDATRVGPEGNWNRALAGADRPFVKLLAQDDLLRPDAVLIQLESLLGEPSAAFSAVQRDIVGTRGQILHAGRGLHGLDSMVDLQAGSRRVVRTATNVFGEGAAVLMRRDAVNDVGGFDGSLPYVIDIDYWLRLLTWGPAIAIKQSLAAFRVTRSAWSNVLAGKQGSQFAAFIDRVAAEPARGIARADVRLGKIRAYTNAYLRQAFYLRHRRAI